MKSYYTNAVAIVAEQLKAAKDGGRGGRILIGAGCSVSGGIPSAAELVHTISEKFPQAVSKLKPALRTSYPDVMDAIPENARRDVILEAVSDKPVGWGYVALARLMEEGFIECALSLNFDTQLQKACSLVDFHPSVYDFSTSPHSDISRIVLPSIVHLHGQSYGYVHRHTKAETAPHLKQIDPLIKHSLNSCPFLVSGYSGIADELINSIEKNYDGRNSLFWTSTDYSVPAHLRGLVSRQHVHFMPKVKFDPFLVELCKSLGCWPPMMLADPPKYSGRLIQKLAKFQSSGVQAEVDLRDFALARLKPLRGSSVSSALSKFEEKLIKLDFLGAIQAAKKPTTEAAINGSPLHKKLLSWALVEHSHELWCLLLENRTSWPLRKQKKILDEIEYYVDHSISIRKTPDNIKNKIIALNLRFYVDGDIDHLINAVEIYKKHGQKSNNALIHYNIMSVFILLIRNNYKMRNIHEKVESAWNKTRQTGEDLSYNYLCYLSVTNQKARAKTIFEQALPAGHLPMVEHMSQDEDLENIRGERWFVKGIESIQI